MGRHLSDMERRATDAERELIEWKKVRFMADKLGEVFSGYVTGVQAFGLFVELEEIYVQGLVHVSSMTDDYYRFDEKAHMPEGREHRERLSPGRPGEGAGGARSSWSDAQDRFRAGGRPGAGGGGAGAGPAAGAPDAGPHGRPPGPDRDAAPPRRRGWQRAAADGAAGGADRTGPGGGIQNT